MSNYPGALSGGFVSHRFQSLKSDQPDLSLVNPTNWNQSHIIGSGAIQSGALGASMVNSGNVSANAITSGSLASGAVVYGTLASGAVSSGGLAANSVVSGDLASGAVTYGTIASGVITSGLVASGAVQWVQLLNTSKPFVVVTKSGPTDGGDFGPGTMGTITAGLQEALTSLSGTGGTVFVRNGTYTVKTTLTLGDYVGLFIPSAVELVGESMDNTIIQVASGGFLATFPGAVIANANWGLGSDHPNSGSSISNLTVDGNNTNNPTPNNNQQQIGIAFVGVNQGRISRVQVRNCGSWGIADYGAYLSGTTTGTPVYNVIEDCIIHDCGAGNGGTNFDAGIFISLHVDHHSVYTRNFIYRISGYGMILEDEPSKLIISENHIFSGAEGIRIFGNSSTVTSKGVIIKANEIFGNGKETNYGAGIDGRPVGTDYLIEGNYIANNDLWGIVLQGQYANCAGLILSKNIVKNNNQVTGGSNPAIYLSALSGVNIQHPIITENQIYDDQATPTQFMPLFSGNIVSGILKNNWFGSNNSGGSPTIAGPNFAIIKDNMGYNPVGNVASPISSGYIGPGNLSGTAAIGSGITYLVYGTDLVVTSISGNPSIVVTASGGGTAIISGASSITALYIPVGYQISWGAFTSAPTVTVFGN